MKTLKLVAIASILLITSCKNFIKINETTAANDPSKIIISTYEGGKISLKDANNTLEKIVARNEKLKGLTFDKLNSEQKETIIKEAVINEIAYKEAKKRKLNKDEDYKEALKIFESELLKQKLFIALAEEAKSEENVKKSYDELVKKIKGKKDLRISYISLKTEKEADSLHKILVKNPNSFSSQAKKKSLDKATAKKGGDLGFVLEDLLPKKISDAAKSLTKGQISDPISLSDKWVIIKLSDERPAQILLFAEAKENLANNLAKKAIEDFVAQSFEKAKISILVK
jgi:peptidyl-prolyl cis-trans isomerase C